MSAISHAPDIDKAVKVANLYFISLLSRTKCLGEPAVSLKEPHLILSASSSANCNPGCIYLPQCIAFTFFSRSSLQFPDLELVISSRFGMLYLGVTDYCES